MSCNAPVCYRNVHISVAKWCIVGYETGALWDLWERSIATTNSVPYFKSSHYNPLENRVTVAFSQMIVRGISLKHSPRGFVCIRNYTMDLQQWYGTDIKVQNTKHTCNRAITTAAMAVVTRVDSLYKGPVIRKTFIIITRTQNDHHYSDVTRVACLN